MRAIQFLIALSLAALTVPAPCSDVAIFKNPCADPDRKTTALESIRRRELTIQGPILLHPEGYLGLVMRLPIFISNVSNPNETFG